jgi:hypothetical protein
MDIESTIDYKKSHALRLGETTPAELDGLSAVWQAAEALSSPNLEARRAGFDSLIAVRAHTRYPLIAYLIATRLADPNMKFRSHIARIVVEILDAKHPGNHVLEAARIRLADYISQMRIRSIYALLQLAESGLSTVDDIAKILNYNPYAGAHLSDILSNWQMPVSIRKRAVILIERVGYIDALPILERVASRLESRYSDKQMSLWELEKGNGEASLLPVVKRALAVLQAP